MICACVYPILCGERNAADAAAAAALLIAAQPSVVLPKLVFPAAAAVQGVAVRVPLRAGLRTEVTADAAAAESELDLRLLPHGVALQQPPEARGAHLAAVRAGAAAQGGRRERLILAAALRFQLEDQAAAHRCTQHEFLAKGAGAARHADAHERCPRKSNRKLSEKPPNIPTKCAVKPSEKPANRHKKATQNRIKKHTAGHHFLVDDPVVTFRGGAIC